MENISIFGLILAAGGLAILAILVLLLRTKLPPRRDRHGDGTAAALAVIPVIGADGGSCGSDGGGGGACN